MVRHVRGGARPAGHGLGEVACVGHPDGAAQADDSGSADQAGRVPGLRQRRLRRRPLRQVLSEGHRVHAVSGVRGSDRELRLHPRHRGAPVGRRAQHLHLARGHRGHSRPGEGHRRPLRPQRPSLLFRLAGGCAGQLRSRRALDRPQRPLHHLRHRRRVRLGVLGRDGRLRRRPRALTKFHSNGLLRCAPLLLLVLVFVLPLHSLYVSRFFLALACMTSFQSNSFVFGRLSTANSCAADAMPPTWRGRNAPDPNVRPTSGKHRASSQPCRTACLLN
mmetsp:Transcript_100044/g.260898  ORF Transcript_100044/g.260898 Transcript_100044/m.260898 type:complete len:276 (+) Transcript_100044:1159-1986(+)